MTFDALAAGQSVFLDANVFLHYFTMHSRYAAAPGIRQLPEDWRPLAMISSTQREALAVLGELCELSPDVRLGQLLAHLGFLGEDQTGRSLWNIDDEQLLAAMYQHRGELVGRQPVLPTPLQQTGAA